MEVSNYIKLEFCAKSINDALARSAVAAFCVELNPTVDQINDIKTAVSEAVTNAVVHAYNYDAKGIVSVEAKIIGSVLHIAVSDTGCGISDVGQALRPFFTTKPEQERSGMGFTVMESYMDKLDVESGKHGTVVRMQKNLSEKSAVSE